MTDIEKLRIILPHWIEHNQSHINEFKKWADIIKDSNKTDIENFLNSAIAGLSDAEEALSKALELLGGPIKNHEEHHHHH